ncbi:trypsin-like peptidase domain-containing protein [Paenibacillus sp. IB182496]|uniref:Trypsin-like peptidase domain-containing protein n=1 Tax=Paenibacillus sabuli TaxID=2772509 RepID=A0A927BS37_9BACL|nr:trypsin-like peptidase domain-containing protein [Paenibacillus sabuli]MBD2845757.1 trypsin-like peptidase domain-containing protein [Paenibacillus sabuli]
MDDQNRRNGYDDFFREGDSERRSEEGDPKAQRGYEQEREQHEQEQHERERHEQEGPQANASERPSHYYTYGPFKTGGGAQGAGTDAYPRAASSERLTRQEDVQITPPAQERGFAPVGKSQPRQSAGWQVREKSRTSFKAIAISFLAGVLLVGGLMAAADYQNWFTSAGPLAQETETASAVTAGGNSSDASTSLANVVMDRPDNIANIFEASSPAVVKIETFTRSGTGASGSDSMDFFRQFFGDEYTTPTPNGNGSGQGELTPLGLGSGFIFEDTGYILTNQHVIGDAERIEVTVQDYAKTFEAKLLGSSYELDLAVLKIEGDEPFPTLPLGDSDSIEIGDWVVAIGNPHGFDHTVTVGVLSAKERPISIPDEQGTRNYEHLLQTDASINPGNSGGPLINTSGEVIGINTAVSSQAQGIGFAIPTSTIKSVLDSLKNNEDIPIPFIGATLLDMNEQYAEQLGIENAEGALVEGVLYNSPAYQGDLRQFDVIVGLNGEGHATASELVEAIKTQKVGDTVTLNVVRGGRELELEVVIGDRNDFASALQR